MGRHMFKISDLVTRLITLFHSAPLPIPQNDQPHLENGRLFHGFRKGIYMYPCDEVPMRHQKVTALRDWLTASSRQQEKDRMDIFHKLFLVSRKGALHKVPLMPNHGPPRILDLGTGTGIWAIDMAE